MSSSGLSTNTAFPGSNTPLARADSTGAPASAWLRFWQTLWLRTGSQAGIDGAAIAAEADDTAMLQAMLQARPPASRPGLPLVVTPGLSPFSYQVPFDGTLLVDGGTVSTITFTRDGATLFTIPGGVVPVNAGDVVTVTYSAAPTMTMVGR